MSLDKSIESGKEHRKQYKTHNEARCEICRQNKQHKHKKQIQKAEADYE